MVVAKMNGTSPHSYTPTSLPYDQGGHIVLGGLDGLGFRTLEELHRLGEDVVIIARAPSETFSEKARAMGATIIQGDHYEESVLRQAGVPNARAIILTDKDDVGNLHAGLIAQDLNPAIFIVLHMFNIELGQQVKALFHKCEVLSSSEISAPAFIAAALHLDWEQRIDVAGHSLVVRAGKGRGRVWGKGRGAVSMNVGMGKDPRILLPLACIKGDGTATLFPDSDPGPDAMPPATGTVCEDVVFLVDSGPSTDGAAQHNPGGKRLFDLRQMARTARSLYTVSDLRLRWLAFILITLTVVSSVIFAAFQGLSLLDGIYFTISTITTTGFGDINLINAHPALKVYGIALMLIGAAGLAVLYALLTDVLVGVRLNQTLGVDAGRFNNHVIVCGLGTIGFRVAEGLWRMGVPVVAAELDPTERFVQSARSMGVPVITADARLPETLRSLGVERARCLVAAIDGDIANLQTALTARSISPRLRVVLRLFDPDLAARMERTFEVHISRSPAALAAPAMVAAAVGGHVLAPIQVADKVVFIAQTTVDPGSYADGNSVECLEEHAEDEEGGMECRVLLLVDGGEQVWRPAKNMTLRAGQAIVLAVSQKGLAHVLALTNPGPPGHWPLGESPNGPHRGSFEGAQEGTSSLPA